MSSEGILRGRDIRSYVAAIVRADAKGYTTAAEFLKRNEYFFRPVHNPILDPLAYDSRGGQVTKVHSSNGENSILVDAPRIPVRQLVEAANMIEGITQESWTEENLKGGIQRIISDVWGTAKEPLKRMSYRALFHYLRWAIAEGVEGSSIVDMMVILGRETTIKRLQRAVTLCQDAQGNFIERGDVEAEHSLSKEKRTRVGTYASYHP